GTAGTRPPPPLRHCFESGDPGFQRCTLLKVLMWPPARTIVGRPIHFITGEKCFNLVLNINIIFGAHRYKPRPRFLVCQSRADVSWRVWNFNSKPRMVIG